MSDGRIDSTERAKELAAKSAAARTPPPEPGAFTILDVIEKGWVEFNQPSWAAWRVVLKARCSLSARRNPAPPGYRGSMADGSLAPWSGW